MSIQFSDEYKYFDFTNNENEITSFNSVVYKDDILQMYLKDIGKTKLLKRGEEQKLGKDKLCSPHDSSCSAYSDYGAHKEPRCTYA